MKKLTNKQLNKIKNITFRYDLYMNRNRKLFDHYVKLQVKFNERFRFYEVSMRFPIYESVFYDKLSHSVLFRFSFHNIHSTKDLDEIFFKMEKLVSQRIIDNI
jgi:hypothetical protein